MRVLIVCLCLILSGCKGPLERAQQDYVCLDRGGVYIYVSILFQVRCNDGSYINDWENTILPEGHRPKPKEKL